jgi:hypothetical protein
MQGDVAQVVRDLLVAEKPDGTPDLGMRQKGVEAYMKNPALLDGDDEEDLLPDGVLLVYPVPPSLRDPEPGWAASDGSRGPSACSFAGSGARRARTRRSPVPPMTQRRSRAARGCLKGGTR